MLGRPVPVRTKCPRCRKVGFVRLENVIKAGRAERHYYCGACNHNWQVVEEAEPPRGGRGGSSTPPKG